MKTSLGIDPGTKSFDLVLIEGDRVVWEKSLPTGKVASDPEIFFESIREVQGMYEIIAGPSGYGAPLVCNEDIVDPDVFASEILLLTDIEDLGKSDEKGFLVYKALAKTVRKLWEKGENACYIPSVILLDTVPLEYKLNKIDLGTADKLASAALALHYLASIERKSYEDIDFLFVESGYGYNSVITVSKGRVINGYGGTLTEMGFMTSGPLDMEVVVAGKKWARTDVFAGGVMTACNTSDLEIALNSDDELCRAASQRMVSSIAEKVFSEYMRTGIRTVVLSGRSFQSSLFMEKLVSSISAIKPRIISSIRLPGETITKEAAQGYAAIGEGLVKGHFHKLVKHMRIVQARGTVMDYLIHPRLRGAREKHRRAYYRALRKEKLEEILQ